MCTQAPRPRRKQLWPDKLSLATKKRLLACHAHGEPFQTSTEAKKQVCEGKEGGDAEVLPLPSACAASATVQPHLHTNSGVYLAPQPVPGAPGDFARVHTIPASSPYGGWANGTSCLGGYGRLVVFSKGIYRVCNAGEFLIRARVLLFANNFLLTNCL